MILQRRLRPRTTAVMPEILRNGWRASAGGLLSILAFGAFINVLKFAMPLYTLQLIDRVPASRSVETLVMLSIVAVAAIFAGVSLEGIRRRLFGRWGAWIKRQLAPPLVQAAMAAPTDADAPRTERVEAALEDLRTLRRFVESAAAALLDLMWAPLFIAVVTLIHPLLGALMVLAIGLRLMLAVYHALVLREPRRAAGAARDEAGGLISEVHRHADTVGALGMAGALARRWQQYNSRRLEQRAVAGARNDLTWALTKGLYRLLYVAGVGGGIYLMLLGELTLGSVIAGNIIMRFGYRLVDGAIRRWPWLGRARSAYTRVRERLTVLEARGATSLTPADRRAPLVARGLAFRYPGAESGVLRGVDIDIEPGSLTAVLGPSGSGKTTLARLLAGQLGTHRGQIRLGNVAVERLPDYVRAELIGYLAQEPAFFSASVRQNIARFDDDEDGSEGFEAVVNIARLVGVHDAIVGLPEGYDTMIDTECPTLSGGERKRIALARALYRYPRLVILDEPEAALDREGRKQLRTALRTLRDSGSSVVVATQSKSLARMADQVLEIGARSVRTYDAHQYAGLQVSNGTAVSSLTRRRRYTGRAS